MNLYTYTRNDPVNSIDVSGRETIFIGGGGEGYGLTSIVDKYAKGRGTWFGHYATYAIKRRIREIHERREPIVIVGHSWGGYRAIYVSSWAEKNNIPIDLLITIDPVGNFSNKFENEFKVSGLWANVEANPRAPDSQLTEGDKWANRGGKTSGSFQSNADVYKEVNTHHEQFVKMMKSIRAQEMICATDPKSPCN